MPEIAALDVRDADAVHEFHDVECAALSADRPSAVGRSLETLTRQVEQPSSFYQRDLLVAREAGRVVGTAMLGMFLTENPHLANLDVVVAPEARRHGVGRALHDEAVRRGRAAGRSTYLSAAFQQDVETPSAGAAFARALGYDFLEEDHHLVLDVPLPDEGRGTAGVADGYEVVTWRDRTPDDLVADLAALQTRLARELPDDGIDREPFVTTVAELREMEERAASVGTRQVAVARRLEDGTMVGYSIADLEHGSHDVSQLDTMVQTAHRGHGLGLAMKEQTLRAIVHEHPDVRAVHTWNAAANTPIQRINLALGFRRVEVAWQIQYRDPDA